MSYYKTGLLWRLLFPTGEEDGRIRRNIGRNTWVERRNSWSLAVSYRETDILIEDAAGNLHVFASDSPTRSTLNRINEIVQAQNRQLRIRRGQLRWVSLVPGDFLTMPYDDGDYIEPNRFDGRAGDVMAQNSLGVLRPRRRIAPAVVTTPAQFYEDRSAVMELDVAAPRPLEIGSMVHPEVAAALESVLPEIPDDQARAYNTTIPPDFTTVPLTWGVVERHLNEVFQRGQEAQRIVLSHRQ